jgi:hypothetical protein
MSRSTCAACVGTSFELTKTSVMGSNYVQYFIQCGTCGSPIGVVPHWNDHDRIVSIEDRIKLIEQKPGVFDPD